MHKKVHGNIRQDNTKQTHSQINVSKHIYLIWQFISLSLWPCGETVSELFTETLKKYNYH